MISERATARLAAFEASLHLNGNRPPGGEWHAGVDLGTATIVTAIVDHLQNPLAGVVTRSRSSIRDGLVLDYMGAIAILKEQVRILAQAGFEPKKACAAFPPGVESRSVRAFGNVVHGAGLELCGLIDEPTAASLALEIEEGAVVDIGGGTTGISILEEGKVVYTADEPTGGIHLDLVLAGHLKVSIEEAEGIKTDPLRQPEIFHLVRPVFQKMATIVRRHIQGRSLKTLYLVGGTSCFPGILDVMAEETSLQVVLPRNPLLVTPLGIAMECVRCAKVEDPGRGSYGA